jgi:hypothetical protein
MNHDHQMVNGENSPIEYLKFSLVITAITVSAWLLANQAAGWQEYLRWFMGIFFLVFAAFKFAGYKMFAMMFAGYDVLAKRVKAYAYAYPFIELGLAVLYIGDFGSNFREAATIIVMGLGSIGVAQEIRRRSGIHCACLGNVIKLPLSTVSLVEDVGMGLMAIVMLIVSN